MNHNTGQLVFFVNMFFEKKLQRNNTQGIDVAAHGVTFQQYQISNKLILSTFCVQSVVTILSIYE